MSKKIQQGIATALLIAIILIIDQWIKIDVKTSMCLHEAHQITNWYYILFVENNGMAYGMSFIPKIALSIFRMIAIGVLSYYLVKTIIGGARWIYVILIAMVIAGAAGNLIDCMFYGMIFSLSTPYDVAHFVPFGEGYSEFLHGRVVDMFYFPIIQTHWPEWMPFIGGKEYIFFSPVFNFADASISVSVVSLILFCRKELSKINAGNSKKAEESQAIEENQE